MKEVLIICEESQAITKEFRKVGIPAVSIDLQECSGGHPEWHLQIDAVKYLETLPDKFVDLIIAHPPCTYLAVCGNRYYAGTQERENAIKWTYKLWELCKKKAKRVCFENPVGVLSTQTDMGKPQYIQPWQFGHTETKKTGLWLYNLPELEETENVKEEMERLPNKEKHKIWYASPSEDRGKLRSKTYTGIAKAIVEQYTKLL